MKKITYFSVLLFCLNITIYAQEVNTLLIAVKNKMIKVKDYEADGIMKTKVVFLKLPVASVKIFFKNPNQ